MAKVERTPVWVPGMNSVGPREGVTAWRGMKTFREYDGREFRGLEGEEEGKRGRPS